MRKRLSERLTYANVMATVAVCLVIGGGVTLAAVSGSAKIKFGAEKGLSISGYETVLSIPGVGKVQAFCEKGTLIRFKNTSGKTLKVTAFSEYNGDREISSVASGGSSLEFYVGGGASGSDHLHVFRASASGTPAADITVGYDYGVDGACPNRTVTAQAVSSE
jgi:hypothetical protein